MISAACVEMQVVWQWVYAHDLSFLQTRIRFFPVRYLNCDYRSFQRGSEDAFDSVTKPITHTNAI